MQHKSCIIRAGFVIRGTTLSNHRNRTKVRSVILIDSIPLPNDLSRTELRDINYPMVTEDTGPALAHRPSVKHTLDNLAPTLYSLRREELDMDVVVFNLLLMVAPAQNLSTYTNLA